MTTIMQITFDQQQKVKRLSRHTHAADFETLRAEADMLIMRSLIPGAMYKALLGAKAAVLKKLNGLEPFQRASAYVIYAHWAVVGQERAALAGLGQADIPHQEAAEHGRAKREAATARHIATILIEDTIVAMREDSELKEFVKAYDMYRDTPRRTTRISKVQPWLDKARSEMDELPAGGYLPSCNHRCTN